MIASGEVEKSERGKKIGVVREEIVRASIRSATQ